MFGIIGAMEEEVSLLRGALSHLHAEKIGRFEFITGTLEGKKVVLLKCGIGKTAASSGCTALIMRYKPAVIINTGSAGALTESAAVGDTVIADALMQTDVDVTAFGYEPGQLPGEAQTFPVGEEYITLAQKVVVSLKEEEKLPADMKALPGLIGSGDTFMHEEALINKLKRLYPKIAACDMEAGAIAHAASLFATPAIVIRAISDIAGKESPVTFDEFLPVASKHSAEIVRRLVRELP